MKRKMMNLIILVISFVTASHGVRLVGLPGNGDVIPVDVSVSHLDRVITTFSGHPNSVHPLSSLFRQTVSLFDFKVGLEARKIIEEDVCYIRAIGKSFDEAVNIIRDAEKSPSKSTRKVVEEWQVPGEEIILENQGETVGERIAQFCTGYKVFWLQGNTQQRTIQGRIKRQAKKKTVKVSVDLKFTYDKKNGAGGSIGVTFNF